MAAMAANTWCGHADHPVVAVPPTGSVPDDMPTPSAPVIAQTTPTRASSHGVGRGRQWIKQIFFEKLKKNSKNVLIFTNFKTSSHESSI